MQIGLQHPDDQRSSPQRELEALVAATQTQIGRTGTRQILAPGALTFRGFAAMTWMTPRTDPQLFQVWYAMLGVDAYVLSWFLSGTTVGGTPSSLLFLTLPPELSIAEGALIARPYNYSDNGTLGTGTVYMDGRSTGASAGANRQTLQFALANGGNWAASTANTQIIGELIVPLR